jgi:hypothetical protein
LVNRHVDCRTSKSTFGSPENLYVWLVEQGNNRVFASQQAFENSAASGFVFGSARLELRMAVSNVAGATKTSPAVNLQKKLEFKARLVGYTPNADYPANAPTITSVRVRPRIDCLAHNTTSASCTFNQVEMVLKLNGDWGDWVTTNISFNWPAPTTPVPPMARVPDMETFRLNRTYFDYSPNNAPFLSNASVTPAYFGNDDGYGLDIRCDRNEAKDTTAGCIFPVAAPVYVLKTWDLNVSEAAEHIKEAQAAGSLGKFKLKVGTRAIADDSTIGSYALQRFKNAGNYGSPNRKAACGEAPTALINTRPASSSATCAPRKAGCSCDEYPFNATYQGAAYFPATTSVKWINERQNRKSGAEFADEVFIQDRVIDGGSRPPPPELPSAGGDYFWVHIPFGS